MFFGFFGAFVAVLHGDGNQALTIGNALFLLGKSLGFLIEGLQAMRDMRGLLFGFVQCVVFFQKLIVRLAHRMLKGHELLFASGALLGVCIKLGGGIFELHLCKG